MECPACDSEVEDSKWFCPKCDAPLHEGEDIIPAGGPEPPPRAEEEKKPDDLYMHRQFQKSWALRILVTVLIIATLILVLLLLARSDRSGEGLVLPALCASAVGLMNRNVLQNPACGNPIPGKNRAPRSVDAAPVPHPSTRNEQFCTGRESLSAPGRRGPFQRAIHKMWLAVSAGDKIVIRH